MGSRVGWVRVHKGILAGDRFIPADLLDRVEGDRIWLKPGVHFE